jgi:hypothetical protein
MEYKKIALLSDIPITALDLAPDGLDFIDEAGNAILSLRGGHLYTKYFDSTLVPPLPADASTHTYVLKAVNGVAQWVLDTDSALDNLMNETF